MRQRRRKFKFQNLEIRNSVSLCVKVKVEKLKQMGSGVSSVKDDLAFCDECRVPIVDGKGVCVYCKTVRLCESCRKDESLTCLGRKNRTCHRFEDSKDNYFCMSCRKNSLKEQCTHCDSKFTIRRTVLTEHHHSASAQEQINPGESLEEALDFVNQILTRHRIGYSQTVESSIDYEKFRQKGACVQQLRTLRRVESNTLNFDDKCSICLNPWNGTATTSPGRRRNTVQLLSQLPCGHCFHGPCIRKWLKWRDTCPVCRTVLPSPDF